MVDIDDTIVDVHGYAKQGAGFGYSGVRGLNALLATVSTDQIAPVIAAQRLRKGAAWFVCAVMAFNLTRAAATLTKARTLARATTATIRRKLVARPSPDRDLRQAPTPAPAHRLALANRLADPLRPLFPRAVTAIA